MNAGSWQTIAIAGVGLIGGSFALALRKAGFKGRILGVSSPRTIQAALERGVIDEGLPLEKAVAQSEMVYLAQPIETIINTLTLVDTAVRPGTLITDAGSTKDRIVAEARRHIRRGRFVGGHPMAGKEVRGVEAADANLFEGRPYVLTGSDRELEDWIARIGGRLVRLEPDEHDRLVALVSHLPQLLSTALASLLTGEGRAASVCGPAAHDMTRLAQSPYDIWRDILATNPQQILLALDALSAKLDQIKDKLRAGQSLEADFLAAADFARHLRRS